MDNFCIPEEKPLVSVIIPVYKVEQYLIRCVESVLAQTYRKLEILLIDDGSPDRCPEICDTLKARDERVQVFHKTNGGVAEARNYGLKYAKGEWICFVDSDDYVKSNYVENLLNYAYKYNGEIICCGYDLVDEQGKILKASVKSFKSDRVLNKEEALYEILCDKIRSYPWNKLFQRSLWTDEKWNIKYQVYEDSSTLYKLFAKANRIVVIEQSLYYYVQRKGSFLHTVNSDLYLKFIEVLNEQEEFIKKNEPLVGEQVPFELLRLEYIRRYFNYCIGSNKVKACLVKQYTWKQKLQLLKKLQKCTDIFDQKSIISNSIFIISLRTYAAWRFVRRLAKEKWNVSKKNHQ